LGELFEAIGLFALSIGGASYLVSSRGAASVPVAILSLFCIPFGPCAAIWVLAGDRRVGLVTGTILGGLLASLFAVLYFLMWIQWAYF